jgi:hypothetical protein
MQEWTLSIPVPFSYTTTAKCCRVSESHKRVCVIWPVCSLIFYIIINFCLSEISIQLSALSMKTCIVHESTGTSPVKGKYLQCEFYPCSHGSWQYADVTCRLFICIQFSILLSSTPLCLKTVSTFTHAFNCFYKKKSLAVFKLKETMKAAAILCYHDTWEIFSTQHDKKENYVCIVLLF